MKFYFHLILATTFFIQGCGGPGSKGELGGVNVGNPMDNSPAALGGSDTYQSIDGYALSVDAESKILADPRKSSTEIRSPEGNLLFIRVVRPADGPLSVSDFEAFLSTLENSNQFDVVERGQERTAVRSRRVNQTDIEERVILTPNRKILWMTSEVKSKSNSEAYHRFKRSVESIRYDLSAPQISNVDLRYEMTNMSLEFSFDVSDNHPKHDIQAQLLIENLSVSATDLNRVLSVNLRASADGKRMMARSRYHLEPGKFVVRQLILMDPLGNRRVFMAPPFGSRYEAWEVPVSQSDVDDFYPQSRPSSFSILSVVFD